MKIKAILAAIAVSSLTVFGQGQINFLTPSASSTWRIFLNDNVSAHTQMPTTAGAFTFFITYGATGGAMSFTTSDIFNSSFSTGKVGETALSVYQVIGVNTTAPIDLQVFGYSTAAGSYAAAQVANSGFYAGSSRIAVGVVPTSSPAPAQTIFASTANGIIGFDLFLAPVPEPSTMVLAGLGAGALLLFRRRKQA